MKTQKETLKQKLLADVTAFDELWKQSQNIQGWFNYPTALLWQLLLSMQDILDVRGDLVELGVFHGKSLIHSLAHCRPEEKHLAVDKELREGLQTTISRSTLNNRVVFRKGLSTTPGLDQDVPGPYRWIHIDAGHDKKNVLADLQLWAPRLSQYGILVMDDFFNFRWAEVTDATFEYMYTCDHNIAPLCIGANKAYFTTTSGHSSYHDILDGKQLTEYAPGLSSLECYNLNIFNYPCLSFRPPITRA